MFMNYQNFAFFCTVKSGWEQDDYLALAVYSGLLILLILINHWASERFTVLWQKILRRVLVACMAIGLVGLIALVFYLAPC